MKPGSSLPEIRRPSSSRISVPASSSVEMTTSAGSGHPSSSLSLAHRVTVLMYHQMRWDPKDPWNPASDRLVLSEGHAVPIVYAAMADLGVAIGKPTASITSTGGSGHAQL